MSSENSNPLWIRIYGEESFIELLESCFGEEEPNFVTEPVNQPEPETARLGLDWVTYAGIAVGAYGMVFPAIGPVLWRAIKAHKSEGQRIRVKTPFGIREIIVRSEMALEDIQSQLAELNLHEQNGGIEEK